MTDTSTYKALLATPIALVQTPLPALNGHALAAPAKLKDVTYGGHGRISGTVKVKGTPDYAVHRRVRLIRERDAVAVREQWSDPVTGAYSFDNIDETLTYTVVSYDHTHTWRATIADNLTPDLMP